MRNKPAAIIILALLHILEPVVKIFYNAYITDSSAFEYIQFTLQRGNAFTFIEEFLLFPIAGIAIWQVKKWSYYVFIAIELWVVIANFTPLKSLFLEGQMVPFWICVFLMVINISVVSYFLLGAIKEPFHNPRMRWWESTPRYTVDNECLTLKTEQENSDSPKKSVIHNISETGLFMENVPDITDGDVVNIEFALTEDYFRVHGRVIHHFHNSGIDGMGIQFENLTPIQKTSLKMKMKELDRNGFPRRPERSGVLHQIKMALSFKSS